MAYTELYDRESTRYRGPRLDVDDTVECGASDDATVAWADNAGEYGIWFRER